VESTYAQRTGAAWLAFTTLYEYMYEGHDVQLKDLLQAERERKGEYAAELALDMERAMLALIGSYRRRTYAHDLVYGIYDLYTSRSGSPGPLLTEGNEHLHQDMKQYFSHMCFRTASTPVHAREPDRHREGLQEEGHSAGRREEVQH